MTEVDKLLQGVAKAAKGEESTDAEAAQVHLSEWVMAYHHFQYAVRSLHCAVTVSLIPIR